MTVLFDKKCLENETKNFFLHRSSTILFSVQISKGTSFSEKSLPSDIKWLLRKMSMTVLFMPPMICVY